MRGVLSEKVSLIASDLVERMEGGLNGRINQMQDSLIKMEITQQRVEQRMEDRICGIEGEMREMKVMLQQLLANTTST